MSNELRAWLNDLRCRGIGSETAAQLIDKCEELAGALEGLVTAARGIPHTGDNLVMGTIDVAIEDAETALRAPGGGEG